MPTWEIHTEPSNVDVVIVPAIDGNFDPSCAEMIPFERQFQTFHSRPELLPAQRAARARASRCRSSTPTRSARRGPISSQRFAERPYFFVRAATPAGAPRRGGPGPLRPGRCDAFTYERPTRLADAVGLLAAHGAEARACWPAART